MKKTIRSSFTFIGMFAGSSGFHQAATLHGGKCVFACETDKYAQQAYEANYGIYPHGDMKTLDLASVPDHDILLADFPCQAFSTIGNVRGFEDTQGLCFLI